MFSLEQVAGQLVFPSTQLLDQRSYDLMEIFQLHVPIVIVSKAEGVTLSQLHPRRNVFNDV